MVGEEGDHGTPSIKKGQEASFLLHLLFFFLSPSLWDEIVHIRVGVYPSANPLGNILTEDHGNVLDEDWGCDSVGKVLATQDQRPQHPSKQSQGDYIHSSVLERDLDGGNLEATG